MPHKPSVALAILPIFPWKGKGPLHHCLIESHCCWPRSWSRPCEMRLSLCPDTPPHTGCVTLLSLGHTRQMRISVQRSSFDGQSHLGCLTSDPGLSACFIHSLHLFTFSTCMCYPLKFPIEKALAVTGSASQKAHYSGLPIGGRQYEPHLVRPWEPQVSSQQSQARRRSGAPKIFWKVCAQA